MNQRSGKPLRPDRHALFEMRALLDYLIGLRGEGDRARFDRDERFRWLLHRLWIAIGNEAVAYATAVGAGERDEPWNRLRRFRNELAHRRLPDVDEGEVWRTTTLRPEQLLSHVNELIQRDVRSP